LQHINYGVWQACGQWLCLPSGNQSAQDLVDQRR